MAKKQGQRAPTGCSVAVANRALTAAKKTTQRALLEAKRTEGVLERAIARSAKALEVHTISKTEASKCRLDRAHAYEADKRRRWEEARAALGRARRHEGAMGIAADHAFSDAPKPPRAKARTAKKKAATKPKASPKKKATKAKPSRKKSAGAPAQLSFPRQTPRMPNLAVPLEQWAARVQKVANGLPESGRYSSERAFISATYKAAMSKGTIPKLSLREFKFKLVEANRAGHLRLHRADLIGAMDPKLVRESETKHLNSEFHFIETPAPWM